MGSEQYGRSKCCHHGICGYVLLSFWCNAICLHNNKRTLILSNQTRTFTQCETQGMFFGAMWWGYISDNYGRKFAYVCATGLTFCAAASTSLAPNLGNGVY